MGFCFSYLNFFNTIDLSVVFMTHWINIIPTFIIFLGCILFLVSNRKPLIFMGLGSIAMSEFIIDIQFGSLPSGFARLVASLSAFLAIFLSMKESNLNFLPITSNMAVFRIISYVLVASLSILTGIRISSFLQIPLEITLSGLLTVFCGLLILGISTSSSKVILGLIILFGGFAGVYGIIEISLLVNGLISAVLLLLGGLGAYLVIREVTVEKV